MTRRLPDRFAAVVFRVALEEDLVDVLRAFFGDLEQPVLARRTVIGNRRLVQMANIVELVAVNHEGVGRVTHHVLGATHSGGVRGIKVAVFFLGPGDDPGQLIKLGFQARVLPQLE